MACGRRPQRLFQGRWGMIKMKVSLEFFKFIKFCSSEVPASGLSLTHFAGVLDLLLSNSLHKSTTKVIWSLKYHVWFSQRAMVERGRGKQACYLIFCFDPLGWEDTLTRPNCLAHSSLYLEWFPSLRSSFLLILQISALKSYFPVNPSVCFCPSKLPWVCAPWCLSLS